MSSKAADGRLGTEGHGLRPAAALNALQTRRAPGRLAPAEETLMTDATIADTAVQDTDESVLQSVADAMRDAASSASEHATKARARMADTGQGVSNAVSRATYATAYTLSYGIVFAAVFVAESVPQDNAFVRGLRDGGVAARDARRSV